jgi:hypothetical protein
VSAHYDSWFHMDSAEKKQEWIRLTGQRYDG